MYKVTMCGIRENEDREYFRIDTLFECEDYKAAFSKADFFAQAVNFAAVEMCKQRDCDGLTIDVRGEQAVSFEIIPHRSMQMFYGEECHE